MRRNTDGRSDDELVAAARAGSEAAFEALYRAHAPRVARRARARASRDENVVADVVQEAFLRAIQNLHRLRDPARFGAWLRSIADHVIADHHRAAARVRLLDDDTAEQIASTDDPPHVVAEGVEAARIVRRSLAGLADRDAEVLTLVSVQGLSPAELGRTLGISSGAAKVRVHRARTRLRAALCSELAVEVPAA